MEVNRPWQSGQGVIPPYAPGLVIDAELKLALPLEARADDREKNPAAGLDFLRVVSGGGDLLPRNVPEPECPSRMVDRVVRAAAAVERERCSDSGGPVMRCFSLHVPV